MLKIFKLLFCGYIYSLLTDKHGFLPEEDSCDGLHLMGKNILKLQMN